MEHEHCYGSNEWKCGTCDKHGMTTEELIVHYRDSDLDSDSELDFTERGVDDEKDNA